MKINFILGADISKKWFNVCLRDNQHRILFEAQVESNIESTQEMIEQLMLIEGVQDLDDIHLVMEHTGLYMTCLLTTWMSSGTKVSVVPANKISQLLSGKQSYKEKTDQLDAQRISEYGIRFADKLTIYQLKSDSLRLLKCLNNNRERLLKALMQITVPVNEQIQCGDQNIGLNIQAINQKANKEIQTAIDATEQQILDIIDAEPQLKTYYKQLNSVVGVGPVTAREILIATNGFTTFTPNQAKAFARYTGVAPRPKQSGNSYTKPKGSKNANMKLKTVLTMAAKAAARSNSELGEYYQRKKKEGKPYFSIINAIRNKIILRAFAVVRNQTMYQRNLNLHLD